jgi:uncharacterized membrane protein
VSRALRLVSIVILIALLLPSAAFAQAPIVRAILFYSPTCARCKTVIQEVLPPLFETYADQLSIVGIDVTVPEGSALYASAIASFGVPEERRGVPMLFVGDVILVGAGEIPETFPGIIDQGLSQGGIDWPAIPGLPEMLAAMQAGAESPEPAPAAPKSVAERLQQDPLGNSLAIVVLIGMLLSLVAVAARWVWRAPGAGSQIGVWISPALAAVGMAVAAYLTLVELTGDQAFCGPVGDCNAVQQSSYAFLFGVIPIGVLGVLGYAAFILMWAASRFVPDRLQDVLRIALFALAVVGTLFSVYLTFLEPFVLGATCAWCLTSAILQTLLLWLTADPARTALARLRGTPPGPKALRGSV